MFLAWNYTLELFFWIILGAVILVSLTILLTSPIFRFKKSETSEETLLLTGESVDSPKGNIVNQDKVFSRIEEELEIPEGNDEEEEMARLGKWVENILRWLRKEWKNVVAYSGIVYSLIVCLFGILIVYEMISSEPNDGFRGVMDNIVGIYGCIVSLIGMAVVYSFLILKTRGNQKWLRYSCRVAAVVLSLLPFSYLIISLVWNGYFCEDCHFPNSSELDITGQDEEGILFGIYLVFASLLFSGDLKRIWKRVSSNENVKWDEQWTRLGKWVGNILRWLRKEWRTIVTYTGVCYFLCVCIFGILIFWEVTQSITHIPGSIFRTILGDIGVFFSATIFLTGVACMLSLVTDNQKWSKYSCRVAAIVLLLFSIFCISVAEMDLDSVSPTQQRFLGILDVDLTNVDSERMWMIRNDVDNAGILSFFFVLGSLLFSGDLKRLWERILSNERIKQLMEKGEFLGIDLRLLFLMGVITLVIGIIIFETRGFWSSFLELTEQL